MKNLAVLLILPLLMVSCSTLKKIPEKDVLQITNFRDAKKLDGNYSSALGAILPFKLKLAADSLAGNRSYVQLQLQDENTLTANLFYEDSLVETTSIKGKIKKNYFVMNNQVKIPAFYLVFNVFKTTKTRIALLPNRNLSADSESGGCGLLVLFPVICSGNQLYDVTFEKVIPQRKN